MSEVTDKRLSLEAIQRAQRRPWRRREAFDMTRPTLAGLIGRYVLLLALVLLSVGPFLWQLSTSLKSVNEDISAFPPSFIPDDPTLAAYETVNNLVPVYSYAMHSAMVAIATVVSNVVLATVAGYVLGCLRFRGRKIVLGLFLSTLLLPGEVTLTSQFLLVNGMGLANSLAGVYIPGAIGAVNVLLMMTACRAIPTSVLDAAILDGASTVQRIRHVVWPNVRGMASVVGVFAFIGAWDDYLWPLIVLSDPAKYTLTVGMAYLNSALGANPREIAAGTIIALVPIIILFAVMQRHFFRGVDSGAVKG
ncbi:carbohydrate ABC transporter permease [Ruania alkalisoli]|uniref:Carbohydrate ABC transporter permease n=1 Tax=Ruania alkalisoli TaxID=2779775 RepID=A0A7M1SR06_9MICO|nr:carbohydrate ABC transporter permease [Ruania alkalisoli]QOR69905.1 carbohydrate ABC transporter permease [Ruania alkalisoli]